MNQEQWAANTIGSELSEHELMLVQGGNIFGDIGRALGGAVEEVGDVISDAAHTLGDAIHRGAQALAEGLAARALADAKRFFSRFHF
jgi:hypothetical protein